MVTKMYLEKYDLKGRVAVVTGGGQGIGLASVHALAEAGAKVVIADYDPKIADRGRAEMSAAGFEVESAEMDVTRPDQVNAVVDRLVASTAHSTSSSTTPGSRGAKCRPKTWRTSAGSTSSTSI